MIYSRKSGWKIIIGFHYLVNNINYDNLRFGIGYNSFASIAEFVFMEINELWQNDVITIYIKYDFLKRERTRLHGDLWLFLCGHVQDMIYFIY